jgi:hypothetical protein
MFDIYLINSDDVTMLFVSVLDYFENVPKFENRLNFKNGLNFKMG